jgi:hypothetical protein
MAALRIQLRRDTAANWVSNNPILLSGELGIETDTLKFKIGNGSRWNATTSYALKAGEANGLATLNSLGKIPSSQLPDSISVGGDFTAAIAALTTNSIAEGSTNKYFTNQRAVDAVSSALSAAIATESTNRNSAIATAKTEAISTASLDATNKASTAKSEAIAAASAAADNKDTIAIASAVSSANSYTDTKSAAEATSRTNAINTAISTEITNRNTAINAAVSGISAGGSSTITLGTVATGNPGTSVSITNTGTATAPLFNFTIPRGDVGPQGLKGDTGLTGAKGDTGNTGPAGIQGPKGDTGTAGTNGTNGTNGANGAAATISVGTVTTGAPGSSAIVTNAGTTSAAVLNFTIPQGAAGTGGSSFSGNSDSITEGTTNLYFTSERAQTANNSRFTDVYVNINQASDEMLTYINSNFTNNSALANTLDGYVMEAEANQPGGYAKLGVVSGTILDSVIPNTIARTSDITAAITNIVNGAPATFDTLKEISDYIASDQTAASSLTTLVGTKLSSATAASTYAPIASPTFTGTVAGITKTMVGLGNVDNTTDLLKPISTATQTALDTKLATSAAASTYATKASPVFTGTVDFSGATVTGITALPSQLNNANKFLLTNGTSASWAPLSDVIVDGTFRAVTLENIGNTFKMGTQTSGAINLTVDGNGRFYYTKVIGGTPLEIINEGSAQTLINKTISGASNTITDLQGSSIVNSSIANTKLANSSITINGTVVALGGNGTISAGAKTFYNNTGTLPTTGMVAGDIYIQY